MTRCLFQGGDIIYFPTVVKLIAFVNQDRRQSIITCGSSDAELSARHNASWYLRHLF